MMSAKQTDHTTLDVLPANSAGSAGTEDSDPPHDSADDPQGSTEHPQDSAEPKAGSPEFEKMKSTSVIKDIEVATSPETLSSILKGREEFRRDIALSVTIVVLMALAFGWLLNKSRVYEPRNIRTQFTYRHWVMIKVFCGAGGTSGVILAVAYKYFPAYWQVARSKYRGVTNLPSTVIGGALLGAGMAISASCPGMILVQIAGGVRHAWVALLGAFVGAFVYGIIDPWLRPYIATSHLPDFLDEKFHEYVSYPTLALVCASCFYGMGIILESVFEWHDDIVLSRDDCRLFDCVCWIPMASGVGIGLLQIPCILWLGNTLGSTSMYTAVMGQWLRLLSDEKQQNWCHFKAQLNRWWQVTYVVMATFGAYFSAVAASHDWNIYTVAGETPAAQFIGGFLMVFGSRLAKGCTSGHGLSGTALLCSTSFFTVGSMFFGGTLAMACWGKLF